MPTFLIALASALLLAALVTEATQRFFPNSYIALLAITFIALLINGLFNARLRQNSASRTTSNTTKRQKQNRSQNERKGGDSRDRGERNNRGGNKSSNRDGNRDSNRTGRNQNRDRNRDQADNTPAPKRETKPASEGAKPAAEENAPRGPQETGEVKWFNRTKGYGFIIRENGDEIFVHQRSIVREGDNRARPVLRDGQKVTFVVAHLEKGAQAEQVKGID